MEKQIKHTPGPWRIDPKVRISNDGGKHAFVEVNATDKAIWIAKVQTFTDDTGEYAANARLIAAAPKLLSALRWSVNHSGECLGDHLELLDVARELLAEVEGANG